ncbi:stage II sporulation protein M [Cohnella luojiensis]|uniref:Stage II sporulation protein M n=1 Tax=Cohnella luojiensis TaxID=652876 RepID=A0A4Y8LR73_9BACL|nr:stage II sporulation protein M [Cohnella luojiensis]TFE23919.1 stage II sporulation protein M [Cohnella luojiensis]
MFSRQGLLESWNEIRPYFIFSIILFFAGVVIGGSPNAPAEFLEQQIKGIRAISEKVNSSDNPERTMFFLITLNNVFNTLLVMGLGIIAGIMPVIMLVSNGMIMGFLLENLSGEGHNIFALVIKGILPHGVFELSAVFLACAFGMRFGITLFKGIAGSALGKKEPWQPFVRTAIGSVPALLVVVVFLLFGAVIESTVTYWLMS